MVKNYIIKNYDSWWCNFQPYQTFNLAITPRHFQREEEEVHYFKVFCGTWTQIDFILQWLFFTHLYDDVMTVCGYISTSVFVVLIHVSVCLFVLSIDVISCLMISMQFQSDYSFTYLIKEHRYKKSIKRCNLHYCIKNLQISDNFAQKSHLEKSLTIVQIMVFAEQPIKVLQKYWDNQ